MPGLFDVPVSSLSDIWALMGGFDAFQEVGPRGVGYQVLSVAVPSLPVDVPGLSGSCWHSQLMSVAGEQRGLATGRWHFWLRLYQSCTLWRVPAIPSTPSWCSLSCPVTWLWGHAVPPKGGRSFFLWLTPRHLHHEGP